jgi:ABC-type Fe3+ transport system substrate-binding protein
MMRARRKTIFLATIVLLTVLPWRLWAAEFQGAPAPWQAQWDRILEGSRREGKVAVVGPVGAAARDVLTKPFEQKYKINVEFWGERGAAIASKLDAERKANQYLWDVIVVGTTTGLRRLIPMGLLDPIETGLILPEVIEPKNWRSGGLEFYDKGRQLLAMTPQHRGILFVNPKLLEPGQIRSYKDLLNPKWKGKIVLDDPRIAGPGQATFSFFYMHPDLGPDFIRALVQQEPLLLRDYSQEVDMVAQGKYPILVGGWDVPAEERMKQGAPITIIDRRQLREGTDIGVINGALGLFNKTPHPNAAKLYLNWILSREGQTAFARSMSYVSGRVDVPTDHVLSWRVPDRSGGIRTDTEEAIQVTETKLRPFLADIFGK